MESIAEEGSLTMLGWLVAAAVIVGIIGLLYFLNEKQKQALLRQQEAQRKRGLDPGPGSEWQR